jgi:hypothetical protein
MIPRHSKNARGPFYVQHNYCIACGAPRHEAPDLIGVDEGDYAHCFFERQPQTPDELERAERAVVVSCCNALRYSGNDPAILKRLKEAGCTDCCDVLEPCAPVEPWLMP